MVFALLFTRGELEAYSIATTPVPLALFEDEVAMTTTEPPVIAANSQCFSLRTVRSVDAIRMLVQNGNLLASISDVAHPCCEYVFCNKPAVLLILAVFAMQDSTNLVTEFGSRVPIRLMDASRTYEYLQRYLNLQTACLHQCRCSVEPSFCPELGIRYKPWCRLEGIRTFNSNRCCCFS
jgi:hypothetical protein